ncbi:histidine phosphatase family protein [Pradoshia sp. D12]|uniref:histidine phosphatase family protein n=1 Tax=Bacillaceae TaxID=186817 RepID=UPI001127321B|nr:MULTISPECIES: histidine phosphatase family protein [Bacillaceae]QFK71930.1 histidine phosphatase family protein [Pradoshia sp. D12]TPF73724.1 histidine phosphatase family protein [Bacillus sp. D12]
MITLYITRHGETVWNTEKRMQGRLDSPLTVKGIQNAISLSKGLLDIDLTAIYSSPSGRAADTATYIKGNRDIPLAFDENLQEINMGDWEGEKQGAIEAAYPDEFDAFWNNPHLFKPVKGETFEEVKERAVNILNRIQHEYESGNILIVTHSVVIKCFYSIFKNTSIESLWDPPFIHDTSLTVVKIEEDGFNIVLEGDLSHRQIII